MMRLFLVAGVALAALASPSRAEGPCGGTWLEPELFSTLPKDKQEAELRRLADGLREGCAEAYNGLGYLASALPGTYTDAVKWFTVLVKVTETQRRQLAVQSALLDQFLAKIDQFSTELKAAEDKANAAAAELAKAKKDQSTALAERDGARADAKIAEEAVNKAQIELAALSATRIEVTESLKQAEQDRDTAAAALAELRKNYDSVNGTLDIKLAELSAQQKRAGEQTSEIAGLQNEKKAMEKTIATLESAAQASAERIKKLEQLVASNAIEINELKSALKTGEATIAQLTGKVRDLEAASADATKKIASLNSEIASLNATITSQKAEIASLEKKLFTETERANRIEAELAGEKSRHASTRAQLSDALAKIESLTKDLQVAKSKIDDLTRQNEASKSKISFLESELDKAKAQITSLENIVKGANAKIAELSDMLGQANAEIVALNGKLGEAQGQIASLKQRVTSLEADLSTANQRVTSLTGERDVADARNKVLQAENDALRKENEALRKRIDALKPYVSEFLMLLNEKLGNEKGIQVKGDRFLVPTEILFASGSSDLSKAGLERVEKIVVVIRELRSIIPPDIKWSLQISGHTDKQLVRPGSYVKDNWELSTRRALSVLRVLEERGISPGLLSAAGYAETRPVALGSSPQDLAQNRRIELRLTPD